jgi:hypothetical protein
MKYFAKFSKTQFSPKQHFSKSIYVFSDPNSHYFDKITSTPFSEEIRDALKLTINESDVEVRPDGALYLPDIKYRNLLNSAFKLGGWAIIPTGKPQATGSYLINEYALFCNGSLISQCFGEISLEFEKMTLPINGNMETVKNDALMKCCKDLGLTPEFSDPTWVHDWLATHTVKVWCEHAITKQRKMLFRRKDRPLFDHPWKEVGMKDAIKTESLSLANTVKPPMSESKQTLEESLAAEAQKILNVDRSQQSIQDLEASIKEGQDKWNNQTKTTIATDTETVDMFAQFAMMNATKVESGNRETPKSGFDINGSISFGKFKDKTWKEALEDKKITDYLTWLANKSTTEYLRQTGRDALNHLNKI